MTDQRAAGGLLKALASGASARELRQLDRISKGSRDSEALELALQIRLQLDEHVERERSLVRLVESVRELAGLDAVEGVLQSIVSRSRKLLMVDVAYFLSFDQATGVARMHVSEGIISDAFARLVVAPNEGISGLIASSRKPSWTSDYLADNRYIHNTPIDSATREENLKAILGVPVLRSGRVVGLLLAADRRQHDFQAQDVELLFSLAQHAGVVIENATVHERGQQTVERLQESVQALESSELATQKILAFQDRLFALLMTDGSLQDLAQLAQSTLGGTTIVGDDQGRILARAGLATSPVREEFGWSIETLGSEPSLLGFVAHLADTSAEDAGTADQRQILSRAATVASLMMSRLHADLNTVRESAANLISELLQNPGGEQAALLRSAVLADVESLRTVLVAAGESSRQISQLVRAAQHLAERAGGLASEVEGTVLMWLPARDPRKAAQEAAAALAGSVGSPVTVGGALITDQLPELRQAAREAHNTMRALRALGRAGQGARASDVAPFPTILANSSPGELETFVRDVLGQLLDYDAQHGTDLVPTLQAVYANASNVTVAAETLFVHANTVHQRLARIDQITGESWRNGDVAIRCQLALTVNALKGVTGSASSITKGISL